MVLICRRVRIHLEDHLDFMGLLKVVYVIYRGGIILNFNSVIYPLRDPFAFIRCSRDGDFAAFLIQVVSYRCISDPYRSAFSLDRCRDPAEPVRLKL